MGRIIKITTVILAAVFLFITGVHGYFSDTLRVTNHIVVGDVNIGLQEFEKKGGTEVVYQNSKVILPGAVLSKIPRITNYAMPCWIRARILFKNQSSHLEGWDDSMLSGFSKYWIKRGEYYYYTQILKKRESVDLFQSVSVPETWTEKYEGESLGITVQAEAIQAVNFEPDFTAMSPWGNQEIQKCVHEQDGTAACKAEKSRLSVEFNGKAHRLMAVPGDFFANMGTAMPGDVFKDTITVSNTTENPAEIFFRTSVEDQNNQQLKILKEIRLTVFLNEKQVYSGNLDSRSLEKNHSLGSYQPGQNGELSFVLEIPEDWENTYALQNAAVQWIFTVNEENSENDQGGEQVSSDAMRKDTWEKDLSAVKTGDETHAAGILLVFLGAGTIILVVAIYRQRRRKL